MVAAIGGITATVFLVGGLLVRPTVMTGICFLSSIRQRDYYVVGKQIKL